MTSVRRAIHIRTGQRSAADALDDWLSAHDVAPIPLTDVYEAAVLLLHKYDDIPDLVLVGADWLTSDEFNIVTYLRQTWPQVGIVVYGGTAGTPLFDVLPLTFTCRTDTELQRIMADTPTTLLERLRSAAGNLLPRSMPSTSRAPLSPRDTSAEQQRDEAAPPATASAKPPRGPALRGDLPPDAPPRSVLSPDELAALLERPQE